MNTTRGDDVDPLAAMVQSSEVPCFERFTATVGRTVDLGRAIGRLLVAGDVVSLNADLGFGKTALAGGIAAGMGLADAAVTSPTFSLIHEYPTDPPLAHCDAYRLADSDDFLALGVSELWEDGVVLVEWGDRVADALPPRTIRITGTIDDDGVRRFAFANWPRVSELPAD